MKLDRQTIQTATIELLNEKGLEALSMRALAQKLDVKAASLYFHLKNKNDLMELIAELISARVYDRLHAVDQVDFNRLAHVLREELKRVNDSPKIFENTYPFTPYRTKLITLAIKTIRDLGIDEKHLTVAGNMGNNFVLSYVADEQYFAQTERLDMPKEFAAAMPAPIDMANPEQAFDYGLAIFLNGLKSMAQHDATDS